MINLRFLGRGSAFNTKEGNTSAYFIRDNTLFLIDCGESIFKKIKEKEIINDDIKNVFVLITHFHSDHVGSLSSLIMYCYYCKNIKCSVYYPDMISIGRLLNSQGCFGIYDYINIEDKSIWNKYEFQIISKAIPHVREINSYCYKILDDDISIMYTGDTCECDNFPLYDTTINYDRIYHDCCLVDYEGNVHTSLKRLCKLYPEEYRSKVWCMHFDCYEAIIKSKELGFNVVEVE